MSVILFTMGPIGSDRTESILKEIRKSTGFYCKHIMASTCADRVAECIESSDIIFMLDPWKSTPTFIHCVFSQIEHIAIMCKNGSPLIIVMTDKDSSEDTDVAVKELVQKEIKMLGDLCSMVKRDFKFRFGNKSYDWEEIYEYLENKYKRPLMINIGWITDSKTFKSNVIDPKGDTYTDHFDSLADVTPERTSEAIYKLLKDKPLFYDERDKRGLYSNIFSSGPLQIVSVRCNEGEITNNFFFDPSNSLQSSSKYWLSEYELRRLFVDLSYPSLEWLKIQLSDPHLAPCDIEINYFVSCKKNLKAVAINMLTLGLMKFEDMWNLIPNERKFS